MPYGGEDCLSAALVLLVLSVADGSVVEGSVAKELSISDRLPTKNRFFTAFRMTTFGFSWGPRPGATGFGSFCRNKMACPELALLALLVLSEVEGSEVEGSEVEGSEAEGSGAEGNEAEGNEVNGPCEGTSSCGGETPQEKAKALDARSPLPSSSTFLIEDPVSLVFLRP